MIITHAYAHGGSPFYALEADPQNPWRFPLFSWDPTLIFFVALAVFYGWALYHHRVRGGGKAMVQSWQVVCFFGGVALNILFLSPLIDDLADQLFFMHMVQHLGVILLGTPLMICGAPFIVLSRYLHSWLRQHIYWPVIKNMGVRRVHDVLSVPLISLLCFNFNFWFWHQPRWYNLALFNDFWHILEHATMAWTAIYLWRHIIDPAPMRSQLPMGVRGLFLASFMALNIILAALLTYADEPWYAYEYVPMPHWWAQHWDRLDDQRLGGLVMWVPGGIITFCAMTICFFAWVHREYESPEQSLRMQQPSQLP